MAASCRFGGTLPPDAACIISTFDPNDATSGSLADVLKKGHADRAQDGHPAP
jgi:hypothetical protein